MTWLKETPCDVVAAFSRMLPRIEADEYRAGATVVGVGHAFKAGPWARRQQVEWDRAANVGRAPKKRPTSSDLAALGVKMKVKANG